MEMPHDRQSEKRHISLTGPGAGLTACNEPLSDCKARGEMTGHLPYSWPGYASLDAWVKAHITCRECRREWEASFDEED